MGTWCSNGWARSGIRSAVAVRRGKGSMTSYFLKKNLGKLKMEKEKGRE